MSASCPSAAGATSGPATCCPLTGSGTGACMETGPAAQKAWISTGLHPRCLRSALQPRCWLYHEPLLDNEPWHLVHRLAVFRSLVVQLPTSGQHLNP